MQSPNLIQYPALAELVKANAVPRIEIRATLDGRFQLVAHVPGQPRILGLQRGGIRFFKTLDAAGTFARCDLGVRHVDLNLAEMPGRSR